MVHVETSQSTRAVANPWKEYFPASLIPYFLHAKAGVVLSPDGVDVSRGSVQFSSLAPSRMGG